MAYKLSTKPRKRPDTVRFGTRLRKTQPEPEFITRREGNELLDRQARKYLQMSGKEFRERYESGNLAGLDEEAVRRVSFILPMSDA